MDDEIFAGIMAIVILALLAVVSYSAFTAGVSGIESDCKDFGKFRASGKIYECKPIGN